jgi:hypothetical protein
MELDHVLIAVVDLAAAGREIEARHGLASIEGGSHPAGGTANRIVPLGDSYLELVAVVDAATAAESAFGRWVASGVSSGPRPLGWASPHVSARRACPTAGSTYSRWRAHYAWRIRL